MTARMPDWLEPMAATLTQDRFTSPEWWFERKIDGIRLLAYKHGPQVRLYSRNRLPQHLPTLSAAIAALPADELILDGETAWDGSGTYHLFDILWLNGRNVTALPLEERRALLRSLPLRPPIRVVEVIDDPAPWERARREGWEGVIAKRRGTPYRAPAIAALAEDEVRGVAGIRGGRVHRPARSTRRPGGPARRLLRRPGPGVCRQGRNRPRYRRPPAPPRAPGSHDRARAAVHARQRAAEGPGALGASGDRRAGGVSRVDGARQAAARPPARAPRRSIALTKAVHRGYRRCNRIRTSHRHVSLGAGSAGGAAGPRPEREARDCRPRRPGPMARGLVPPAWRLRHARGRGLLPAGGRGAGH